MKYVRLLVVVGALAGCAGLDDYCHDGYYEPALPMCQPSAPTVSSASGRIVPVPVAPAGGQTQEPPH